MQILKHYFYTVASVNIKPLLLFSCLAFALNGGATPEKGFYNVTDFGARGDGTSINSDAINKAIDKAAAAGGGTIYFPAGEYLSYTIRLKSNISLYLEQGAKLIGAEPVNGIGYDKPEQNPFDMYQDFGHSHFKTSLIYGEGLHDISILGQGLIWGRGMIMYTDKTIPEGAGNIAIALKKCINVNIGYITILHGGHFGILATGVDNLTIDNVKMDTNRDGMDIDCCKNVRISNCTINSPNDDAICLKSSFSLGYARATENVTITNCQVSAYDEGSVLDGTYKKITSHKGNRNGRIKLGTESNGGFKNIAISNCVFDFSHGLALETVDGGLLEDITITNITMRDVVDAPFFIRLGARMRGPDTIAVGACRRIIISNIMVYNADIRHGGIISGLQGHPIEDLQMSNIRIYYKGGGTAEMAKRLVPEFEKDYPEPNRFGVMPSYGFYVRHVKNFKMHDVEISYMNEDLRPPFIFIDVKDVQLHHIRAQKTTGVPTFVLKDVEAFCIDKVEGLKDRRIKNAKERKL